MQIHINETLVYSTRWDLPSEDRADQPKQAGVQVEILISDERHEALAKGRMSLASFVRGPLKGHVAF